MKSKKVALQNVEAGQMFMLNRKLCLSLGCVEFERLSYVEVKTGAYDGCSVPLFYRSASKFNIKTGWFENTGRNRMVTLVPYRFNAKTLRFSR